MSILSVAQNFLSKCCQQGLTDRANFLKNIAVTGWILSSLAQTTAIVFNDKIPTKEKRFLIPQEILDGIINCTLFWFISSKATDFGKKLILTKKVLPKSISHFMKNFEPVKNNIGKMKEAFLNHLIKNGGTDKLSDAKYAIDGMGVLAGLVGAVLSNNICTPLIRNKLASKYQQHELQKLSNKNLNPKFGELDYSKYNFGKLAPAPKNPAFAAFHSNGTFKI